MTYNVLSGTLNTNQPTNTLAAIVNTEFTGLYHCNVLISQRQKPRPLRG